MFIEWLILIPVFLPVVGGVLMWLIPAIRNSRRVRNVYVLLVLFLSGASNLPVIFAGDVFFELVKVTDTISIAFKVDDLARFFSILMIFVWILVGIYAIGYMKHEENEVRYFAFYLIVMGVLSALFFSSNLVTMYMFYEMMTLSALPLVLHTMKKKAVEAGLKYLFYSIAGAFMALLAIFFLGRYTTTLDFVAGGTLDAAKLAGNEGVLLTMTFMAIIGFGCKAGMYPLHGWLPAAHPEAPAPASAVLSGIITKAGVFALIRLVFYSVGADFLRGTWVQYAWIILTLVTVFMGSMLAYREKLLKRRLAFSTVSQLSYVLFGLSLLGRVGFVGALMHVVFHSLVKDALFLCAGSIIHQTGSVNTDEMTGVGKRMPVTMWCYTLVSITLIGIPPTSAFVSKWYLASGSLEAAPGALSWIGPVVLLISALLTAGYLLPLTVRGFFPGDGFDYEKTKKCETGAVMYVPVIIFTVAAVLFGMFPNQLIDFISNIAGTIM